MEQHLYEHFNSECYNGLLENVFVILIDKTDGFQPKFNLKKKKKLLDQNPDNPSTTKPHC